MKRTKKNRQADCLQTGKSERTAASAAKCTTDYDQENTGVDFRKDKGRDKPLSTFLQASEIKTRQCIMIAIPRPVPWTLVVRWSSARLKGSNMIFWNSGDIPIPLSSIVNS